LSQSFEVPNVNEKACNVTPVISDLCNVTVEWLAILRRIQKASVWTSDPETSYHD